MCRNHLRLTWLTFLGLIYILGSTDCYLELKDDHEDGNYWESEFYPSYLEEEDENGDGSFLTAMHKRTPAFTPHISLGALSNIQQFFENLKENFKSLEDLANDDGKLMSGKQERSTDTETRIYRPPATAAFLHAVRNRPPHRVKSFLSKVEPSSFRGGTNHYSPASHWAGVGRKR